MTIFDEGLAEVVQRDPRYAYEAYEFIFHALHYTQKKLGKLPPDEGAKMEQEGTMPEYHVSGQQLMEGVRDLALEEFGLMARTVFKMWGVNRTDDFGAIVFNLIEAGLMSKTDKDNLDDFKNVYDMDEALTKGFRIHLDENR